MTPVSGKSRILRESSAKIISDGIIHGLYLQLVANYGGTGTGKAIIINHSTTIVSDCGCGEWCPDLTHTALGPRETSSSRWFPTAKSRHTSFYSCVYLVFFDFNVDE